MDSNVSYMLPIPILTSPFLLLPNNVQFHPSCCTLSLKVQIFPLITLFSQTLSINVLPVIYKTTFQVLNKLKLTFSGCVYHYCNTVKCAFLSCQVHRLFNTTMVTPQLKFGCQPCKPNNKISIFRR
jgi:hypothetical protein